MGNLGDVLGPRMEEFGRFCWPREALSLHFVRLSVYKHTLDYGKVETAQRGHVFGKARSPQAMVNVPNKKCQVCSAADPKVLACWRWTTGPFCCQNNTALSSFKVDLWSWRA